MRIKTAITLMVLLGLAFTGLIWRCGSLQILSCKKFEGMTQKQQTVKIAQPSRRGMILDRNGNQLAVSNITYTVFADPCFVQDNKETAIKLSGIINVPAHEISQKITKPDNPKYSVLKKDVTLTEREAVFQARLKGISVENSWQRYLPGGRITSHVVGFCGVDNMGLAGLELEYEKLLRGQDGYSIFVADAARRPIRLADTAQVKPRDGSSIVLTIDSTIQSFTYNALMAQYKKYQAESAVAIVMEPKSGDILAMVSLPDFEPSQFFEANIETMKNRSITDTYEPGSIFKPIVTAIAIDTGAVAKTTPIFCENGTYIGKGFGRIGEYDSHRYGTLTPKGILVHSSNIGMAKIGQKLGKQRLYDGLRLFGLGRKTGIDLPGEDAGLLWPVKGWTGYSVTRIPYGQEISVTSIQIIRAYCILANGGKAVKPHLVKAVISEEGRNVELSNSASAAGFAIKPATAKWIVSDALVAVVKEGTGKPAALKKWTVFGKTGTANIALPGGGGYDESSYIASFVGGAPAEDPAIVVLVSVRRPNRSLRMGYTGGMVAAPVVKEIIEKTLTYLER